MKLIFLLTLIISYLALSKAITPYEAGYRFLLGPLEIFLKSGKNEIGKCYEDYKNVYEKSINSYTTRVEQIRNLFDSSFVIRQPYGGFMWGGWNEMSYIAKGLQKFIKEFNDKISKGKLYDGGNEIARERAIVEVQYLWYEKQKNNLKNVHQPYYEQVYRGVMDEAFEKIYKNTTDIIDKVLKCLESKGVTYTRKY